MIDPVKATNYKRSQVQLEEFLLFCVAVAGKNATVTARNLDRLLKYAHETAAIYEWRPFYALQRLEEIFPRQLPETMRRMGFGSYTKKAGYLLAAVRSGLNLQTCTREELDALPGIGLKTASYFILHTRRNEQIACLDTHILKYLRGRRYKNIPKSSPQSPKQYLRVEKVFLEIAKKQNVSPAKLDLELWNKSRGS